MSILKTLRGGKVDEDEQTQSYPTSSSQSYLFFTGFPFPLGPTFQRNTVRTEVEKDSIWVFEQTQALEFVDVYTPVRMTAIKLKSGALWIHAPCAPTTECIRLIKELGYPVKYIVLPTFAYEHKAFVGPFSRCFPKAQVYVSPNQWSFPLNLPNEFFGIFNAKVLKASDPTDPDPLPWEDEILSKPLDAPTIVGADFVRNGEVAFFHKRTRTLLVTDAVIYIPRKPAKVVPKQALLALGKDNWISRFRAGGRSAKDVDAIGRTQRGDDTPENRLRGWMRMSLLVLYFNPADILTPEESFDAIAERLIVPPVCETLVYNKFPAAIRRWVDSITSEWNFTQVIPCHFAGPVKTTPAEFKEAFAFAYEGVEGEELEQQQQRPQQAGGFAGVVASFVQNILPGNDTRKKPASKFEFPEADISTLRGLNKLLVETGTIKANGDVA